MRGIIIGVTGHRNITNENELVKILKNELKKLSFSYTLKSVISPLADGADRLVVDILMNFYTAKLVVSLPFEKDEYKKDFSISSQRAFDSLLNQADKVYEVDALKDNSREVCYLNVGKAVVDQCNLLVALWDGKQANGLGGTGDIVVYAKKKRKAILHINTNSLKVEYINFEGIL